jgi:hypothetical protein
MSNRKQITDLEAAYFELQKIKRRVNALSDFLASKISGQHSNKPKTQFLIDPRTSQPFRKKRENKDARMDNQGEVNVS